MSQPDYEAAADLYSTQAGEPGWILEATKRVVDAAIGELRLVSPTALVIERDENGEWPEWALRRMEALSGKWALETLASSQGVEPT